MNRYVTFRFDDGFFEGARKAVAILYPNMASFFVVINRILGTAQLNHIELLKGHNFGSVEKWTNISALGHDVQPHSLTHPNFANLNKYQQGAEVSGSIDFIRNIHSGPYIFGFPFNIIPQALDLESFGLSAAGFVSETSDDSIIFNRLDDKEFDLFRLRSWAVRERHLSKITDQIEQLPDESWTVLGLHSLDGEGWEPWTSGGFSTLVAVIRASGLQIVTARDMVYSLTRNKQI